eukprot:TRINITY_DN1348_c0_g1_i1.p1 TRINITY_DN1348_c0_g1~~TRINITY_DN1348_c0_g1_i1.p1  ORF type:complete len:305 (-),score=58.67 TRINITY_DN1348_c0_g1_i1:89-1003(-)
MGQHAALVALVLLLCGGAVVNAAKYEHWLGAKAEPEDAREALAAKSAGSLPTSWDWRDVNGTNYMSPMRNQHVPVHCGSCWAHAVTSMLNDRFRIAALQKFSQLMLAPQQLVDCTKNGSCLVGFPGQCHEYAKTVGLVDETCKPYLAVKTNCRDECYTCVSFTDECMVIPPAGIVRYYVDEYGSYNKLLHKDMVQQIQTEIMTRGPVVAEVAAVDAFVNWYSPDVFEHTEKVNVFNHAVSLFGWGTDTASGLDYWLVRNSWGTFWGDPTAPGTAKVRRGNDTIGIESLIWWATPDVKRSGLREQ